MNHQKKGRKLGRPRNQRRALLKTLSVSLVNNDKIKTTEAKAKELRPFLERLVTYGKKGGVSNMRRLVTLVGEEPAKKLTGEIATRYKDRDGGYLRITKVSTNRTDAAKMAYIEFV